MIVIDAAIMDASNDDQTKAVDMLAIESRATRATNDLLLDMKTKRTVLMAMSQLKAKRPLLTLNHTSKLNPSTEASLLHLRTGL